MYYRLNCLITIKTAERTIKFSSVNAVTVKKSIDKVGSSATIVIPTSAHLVADGVATESMQVASVFKRGDAVNIQLGYDNDLVEEFDGFIYKINLKTPLEIECEGHEFLLREDVPVKTFASTTLKGLLQYIIDKKNITISGKIPEIGMTNYVIPANLSRLDALQQIKERYGITIFFDKNNLYAGLDYVQYLGGVVYSLGVNTPRTDELKYQYADDVKLKVKAIQVQKNNKKLEVEVGDPKGSLRTLYFYNTKDEAGLKKLAETEIKKYKYTGYTGKITAFLQPYCTPGMVAEIRDVNYAERQGKFEVRSVDINFNTNGGRRIVEIGKIVSNG